MPLATRWFMIDSGSLSNNLTLNNLQFYINPQSYSGSGNIWNDLKTGSNVTLYNSPPYNSTGGFTFNGSTQYGSFSSVLGKTNFNATQDYTIEVWCYINSVQNYTVNADNSILEKWYSSGQGSYPYVLRYLRSTGNVIFAVYNGTANPVALIPVTTNVWVQLVGVFDHTNNILKVYKNGQFITSSTMNIAGTINNDSTVEIGRRANIGGASGINYFTGQVGIVRIYNNVLSNGQVLNNFNYDRKVYGL